MTSATAVFVKQATRFLEEAEHELQAPAGGDAGLAATLERARRFHSRAAATKRVATPTKPERAPDRSPQSRNQQPGVPPAYRASLETLSAYRALKARQHQQQQQKQQQHWQGQEKHPENDDHICADRGASAARRSPRCNSVSLSSSPSSSTSAAATSSTSARLPPVYASIRELAEAYQSVSDHHRNGHRHAAATQASPQQQVRAI